jgi:hypothetical protein
MSLGVNKSKIFLSLKDGKISLKKRSGEIALYDYIEGYLVEIKKVDREFKGEIVPYWYIDLQDNKGDIYSLAIHYNSGVAKSILNSLGSVETLGIVRIETYLKDEFTKAVVYNNGERLNWRYTELPPVEMVKVGDKTVKDESKRMELFNNLASEISGKVSKVI